MTRRSGVRGALAPVVASIVTAAVLVGALWVQRQRHGWPFSSAPQQALAAPTSAAAAGDMAGMDMSGEIAENPPSRVAIEVAPETLQTLGMQTQEVRREALTDTIQAVATVAPDESRISHVHTRVAGWVEQLDVNTTGESVRAGQPLARVFSQELLSSQTEYLAARQAVVASGISSAVIASGRTRLSVLGMAPEEIAAIEASGEPKRLITVVAPRSGVVITRGVTVGTAIDPSTPLLTIADLSSVWVLAEVPEASIPSVRSGTNATLDFPASGRPPFISRVSFLYPTLTDRTRTLRVRFSVANTRGTLRPGLYGTAAFTVAGTPAITVPRDAVVDTGRQQHVFVAVGDRFEPRPVTLGLQLADRVEVRTGLNDGDRVVTAGVFLLDSESRLRATGGMGGHAHGSTPAREATPATPPSVDPHAGHKE
ncbi:efflux RND transporter periplasmic adaptor subunit [Luteitalea sp.]|uniref:efflux RND transporter periplasmic adaptor subunit n=1 Tax=Luteitalea sp. TaxID=2004800 RepID=UPI0025C7157D|nr:efflux RND transporter periplasmic adaptor subunit [Luteitalea sp.]